MQGGVGSQGDGCALCSSFPPQDQLEGTESWPARWTAGAPGPPCSCRASLPLRAPVPPSAAPAPRLCCRLPLWMCLWVREPGWCPALVSESARTDTSLLRVHGGGRTREQGQAALCSTVRCGRSLPSAKPSFRGLLKGAQGSRAHGPCAVGASALRPCFAVSGLIQPVSCGC